LTEVGKFAHINVPSSPPLSQVQLIQWGRAAPTLCASLSFQLAKPPQKCPFRPRALGAAISKDWDGKWLHVKGRSPRSTSQVQSIHWWHFQKIHSSSSFRLLSLRNGCFAHHFPTNWERRLRLTEAVKGIIQMLVLVHHSIKYNRSAGGNFKRSHHHGRFGRQNTAKTPFSLEFGATIGSGDIKRLAQRMAAQRVCSVQSSHTAQSSPWWPNQTIRSSWSFALTNSSKTPFSPVLTILRNGENQRIALVKSTK